MLWYQSVTPPNQGWRKRPGVEDFMYSITTTSIIVLKVNTTIINIIEKVTPKYMFTWFESITLWYKMNYLTIYRPILKTLLISCFTEFLRIQVVLKKCQQLSWWVHKLLKVRVWKPIFVMSCVLPRKIQYFPYKSDV